MQGHAAANLTPLIASNRIGTEPGANGTYITFYGSSFIADHTGGKIAEADRNEEAVLTATFDLDSHRAYPRLLGRLPRPSAGHVWPAADTGWKNPRHAAGR